LRVLMTLKLISQLMTIMMRNTRNQFVAGVWRALNQVTEPILRPIRRIVPPMGGLDLSPIVVFIIIFFLQQFIANFAMTGRLL